MGRCCMNGDVQSLKVRLVLWCTWCYSRLVAGLFFECLVRFFYQVFVAILFFLKFDLFVRFLCVWRNQDMCIKRSCVRTVQTVRGATTTPASHVRTTRDVNRRSRVTPTFRRTVTFIAATSRASASTAASRASSPGHVTRRCPPPTTRPSQNAALWYLNHYG